MHKPNSLAWNDAPLRGFKDAGYRKIVVANHSDGRKIIDRV